MIDIKKWYVKLLFSWSVCILTILVNYNFILDISLVVYNIIFWFSISGLMIITPVLCVAMTLMDGKEGMWLRKINAKIRH